MNKAYLALGTNIDPRQSYLSRAMELLENEKITILKKSSIYETPPVGYTDQADFLNMVLEVQTVLSSEGLLNTCQTIEKELGRERLIRFGPRTIDLDILVYNDENKKTERLTIPHPRMHERGFVLVPLHEIAPNLKLPSLNKTTDELLQELPAKEKKDITIWNKSEQGKELRRFEN
ncbi:2-amino-4-hydroxy-6-hydroxymethyldihydropteridine diphosphokinase [Ornithinibacillus scapharcae]|uniref:2-amino-4-hydroxy-6- hydroxymethyldihydropteridine diphosphokinase n=1 Tax=Ornithinibacillus scapharcae TaxID=1147159 RepID=UPI000225AA9D|nr:2-amino-4-hydroxy-6-hydroxymethyldihydropteridine diphosphokinase [Ornithinibacillus scapharcae]